MRGKRQKREVKGQNSKVKSKKAEGKERLDGMFDRMVKNPCDAVILSEAKDLLFSKSTTEQILRRPDEVNRDSSE